MTASLLCHDAGPLFVAFSSCICLRGSPLFFIPSLCLCIHRGTWGFWWECVAISQAPRGRKGALPALFFCSEESSVDKGQPQMHLALFEL